MRKKSKYKPKPVRNNTIAYVIAGMATVSNVPEAGLLLQLKNRAALDEILLGRGNRDHVEILIGMVNMAEVLASFGIGQDWMPEIEEAQEAVHNMAQRGISGKPFLFTGLEMQIVKTIQALHDQQLQQCTVKQMEQANDHIAKAVKHGKARQIVPKVAA